MIVGNQFDALTFLDSFGVCVEVEFRFIKMGEGLYGNARMGWRRRCACKYVEFFI